MFKGKDYGFKMKGLIPDSTNSILKTERSSMKIILTQVVFYY